MKTPDTVHHTLPSGHPSRRAFIGNCAALASLPILASIPATAFAAGANERLKVGLIGCGGRGKSAVGDCLKADRDVQIWAIGDVFADRVNGAKKAFANNPRSNVPQERCFSGFDAYKQVIASGVDIVILAAPPHFRPAHMAEAIAKNVHIFAEKPVAVDAAGARKVIELGELAAQKKLSVVAGTQRRHDWGYRETMKRVREGAIGELISGQAYWVGGSTDGFWPHHKRRNNWSEMEYQLRNWYGFTWLCGDHIVEQHVHNLDIMNWAFGGPPVKAFGVGGRQTRTWGNIWDHFAVEFEYANGVRVQSFCRQTNNTANRVNEHLVGTLGTAIPSGRIKAKGKDDWRYSGKSVSPYVQEHIDLIQGIRNGAPVNEARILAESALTGILGRISAYTGKEVGYKWLLGASKEDLSPSAYTFEGTPPPAEIAIPGKTPLP
ncbi:MAG: Gfo/Idh/MocA family oxidoreductase [Puniceicoccales bacterium]|nr:Gfo/Idh/MocA family oxidoreductase [Puniceicoccales bacterium]